VPAPRGRRHEPATAEALRAAAEAVRAARDVVRAIRAAAETHAAKDEPPRATAEASAATTGPAPAAETVAAAPAPEPVAAMAAPAPEPVATTHEPTPVKEPDPAPDEPAADAHDLREAAAHGIRWASIARPTIEVLQLGSIVVLARLVGPADFGHFAVAAIAQEVAYLIVAGGLSSALVQRKSIGREHLESGMALGLCLGLALAVLTLAAASWVVDPVFGSRTASFVRLMSPLCLVSALNTVPLATLRRRLALRRLAEIEMLSTLTRVAVAIGLAVAGLNGEALVLGVVAGCAVTLLITWVSAPPPAPRLHRRASRELLGYGLPASLAAFSWVGFSNVDYALIGARLGALQTGFYFRAYTLAVEYQNKVSIVMGQVGFPVLSRTDSAAELTRLHRQMVRLLTLVVFPLLVLLAIGAPVLVPFLFGDRWDPAVVPVQILALGGASTLVIDAAGTVLMAKGRARALLGYGVAHFSAYGLAVYLLVPFGIVAVAIGAAVVHTLFLFVAYALILNDSPERPLRRLWEDVAPSTVSCIGLTAAALPASYALTAAGLSQPVWLALLGAVGIPAYLATLRVCFPDVWRTQAAVVRRVLPDFGRLRRLRPRRVAPRLRSAA
jgi:lipopolysaccharide exporter